MTPVKLLETALLLGLYVLLAGGYALTYTFARLKSNSLLSRGAFALFTLHVAVSLLIILWTPLGDGWKVMLIASTLAIAAIPPVVWRYLEYTHGTGRASA